MSSKKGNFNNPPQSHFQKANGGFYFKTAVCLNNIVLGHNHTPAATTVFLLAVVPGKIVFRSSLLF